MTIHVHGCSGASGTQPGPATTAGETIARGASRTNGRGWIGGGSGGRAGGGAEAITSRFARADAAARRTALTPPSGTTSHFPSRRAASPIEVITPSMLTRSPFGKNRARIVGPERSTLSPRSWYASPVSRARALASIGPATGGAGAAIGAGVVGGGATSPSAEGPRPRGRDAHAASPPAATRTAATRAETHVRMEQGLPARADARRSPWNRSGFTPS